jgi:glycosyltransferase involved in cell wall biosynthesis
MEPATTAPRVSVLIRAYRSPTLLASAIESVLAQTYADFEVVVSDDSGELAPVCERFQDPRVRYSANPAPRGPAANLRRAAELGRGELLAILNDDDRWEPRFLEVAVRQFDLDSGLGVVFTDYWSDIRGRRVRNRFPYAPGRHDSFLGQLLEHSIPVSGNVMRREVWEDGERRVPLHDGMVGDDTTWLRAAASGWAFHFVPEPLAVMRVHAGQLSWSERSLPARNIATLAAFRFDDPVCERLRRARLAENHLARARLHLRAGRARAAVADLRAARRDAPHVSRLRAALALSGMRRAVMRWGSSHPRLLAPLLELWPHLRPPVVPDSFREPSFEHPSTGMTRPVHRR